MTSITTSAEQDFAANRKAQGRRVSTRKLNVPFLLISLGIMAVIGLAAFGIRTWQVSRTAGVFLERADTLEQEENWLRAAEYINRYLQLSPNSGDERIRLAKVYAKGATTYAQRQRGIDLFYRAIGVGQADEELALRKQVGEFLLLNARYVEAQSEAEALLAASATDSAGLRIKALAIVGQYRAGSLANLLTSEKSGTVKIIEPLAVAHRALPDDVELARLLAGAYLDEELVRNEIPDKSLSERTALAETCLGELIAARPTDAQAYLVRFLFRRSQKLPEAPDDLAEALKLGPDDLAVLLVAAQDARDEGQRLRREKESRDEVTKRLEQALAYYQKIETLKLAPKNPLPKVAVGEILLELDRKDEAIATWKAGLSAFKDSPGVFHTHLADLWLDLGQTDLAAPSIEAIQTEIDRLRAKMPREALLLAERDQDLRSGVWHMKRGESRLAVPKLQDVVSRQEQIGGESTQSMRALLLLGTAFASLGEWNDSAAAFDRAALQQPNFAVPRIAASASWLAANRPDLAVERAEHGARLDPTSKSWFTLAAACFQQQSILSPEDRIWVRFERALDEATNRIDDGSLDEPWRVDLLRADFLVAKGSDSNLPEEGQKQAVDVLHRAETKYPLVKPIWLMLPLVYQRLARPEEADRALEHLRQLPNGSADAQIVQSRLLSLRGQYDAAEQALAAKVPGETPLDPTIVQRELVNLKLARRDLPAARKLLAQLQVQYPKDLITLRKLADIDLESRQSSEVAKWEKQMASTGGVGLILARYFKIRRLLLESTSAADAKLAEASNEQAQLVHLRPTWAEAVALRGVIDQRRGRLDSAIAAYERAIELGEQRVSVFEQLLGLLEQANRSADAEKYLSRLKSHVAFSQDLTVFESTVEIRRNQPAQAIEVARRGVEKRPDNAAARIWLGRMLLVNNQREEAEKEFEKAVSLQPDEVRAWNGLFSFHLRTGDKAKARETLTRLAEKAKLTAAERSFVLAQGYDLLGDQEEAAAEYQRAADQAPDNSAILLRMAGFHLRGNPDEAQVCLRKVLKIDPQSGVARRTLAAILAAGGKDADWKEVEELLKPRSSDDVSSSQDNRLQAVLLTQRGGTDNFQRAVEILEALIARPENAVVADRLMLAQLYEKLARITPDEAATKVAVGRTKEQYLALCREQYVTLCARAAFQPGHLISFVEYLLRHDQKEEAGRWLDTFSERLATAAQPSPTLLVEYVRLRIAQGDPAGAERWQASLEKSSPDAIPTISLRARLLDKQGKRAEVEPFVEAAAKRLLEPVTEEKQRAAILQGIGGIYGSLQMPAQAEIWYRKLHAQIPTAYESLVMVLTQQGLTMEAIEICQKAAAEETTPRAALVAAAVLMSGKAAVAETLLAEKMITSALEKYPKDLRLLFSVATLRVTQNQTADAARLFRQVVDLNPRHVLALNNLATLLSEQPDQRKEALKLIDQAIEITGKEAALFDTKGTILVFDGQSDKAVDFLKIAVDGADTDPRYRFHLALAYKDLKEFEQARSELAQALQQNLEKQILTPTEQKLLSELRSVLTP